MATQHKDSNSRADPQSGHAPSSEGIASAAERCAGAAPAIAADAAWPTFPVPAKPPDVRAARAFRPGHAGMSGAAANAAVTNGYQALDRAFAAYLGDPPLAVWVTFAKYASRQVGKWIRITEDVMTMAHAVHRGGAIPRGLAAARDLLSAGAGLRLVDVAQPGVARALSAGLDPLGRVAVVRDALVEANTEIFARIGASFHAFLAGEARGAGRAAMAELVRSGAVEDPMGNLSRGFELYERARALGVRARAACRSEREVLLALRRRLVAEANWLLAVQEQALIQRPSIFDHPVMRDVLRHARAGSLQLSLAGREESAPSERFALLPQGGSWADFATRMGLRPIEGGARPPGAIMVTLPGRATAEAFAPDERRWGTIRDLFSRYLDGPAGDRLVRGAPRP